MEIREQISIDLTSEEVHKIVQDYLDAQGLGVKVECCFSSKYGPNELTAYCKRKDNPLVPPKKTWKDRLYSLWSYV